MNSVDACSPSELIVASHEKVEHSTGFMAQIGQLTVAAF